MMNVLIVSGQTFPLRQHLTDVMEWDDVNHWYAMYVHELNEEEVAQVLQLVSKASGVTSRFMPEKEYAAQYLAPAASASGKQQATGRGGRRSAQGQVAGHFAQAAQAQQPDPREAFAQQNPDVVAWLKNYRGDFAFYLSVRDQYEGRGTLSPKQVEAIKRAIARDQKPARDPQATAPQAATPAVPQKMDQSKATYAPGTVLQLKKFFATKLQQEIGMSHLFVNVEIVETIRETAKAIQATIRFSARYSTTCSCCGRVLDNQVSRATGIGPICADKMGISQYSLENAQAVLKELESKLQQLGQKTVWIPRSGIKQVVNNREVAS